ncbi:hypothetical protein Bca4012_084237 [Brassica carinata]
MLLMSTVRGDTSRTSFNCSRDSRRTPSAALGNFHRRSQDLHHVCQARNDSFQLMEPQRRKTRAFATSWSASNRSCPGSTSSTTSPSTLDEHSHLDSKFREDLYRSPSTLSKTPSPPHNFIRMEEDTKAISLSMALQRHRCLNPLKQSTSHASTPMPIKQSKNGLLFVVDLKQPTSHELLDAASLGTCTIARSQP